MFISLMFVDVWGRQDWLYVIYTACLLDVTITIRIGRFTKLDGDRYII